jgi:hypothetical protein
MQPTACSTHGKIILNSVLWIISVLGIHRRTFLQHNVFRHQSTVHCSFGNISSPNLNKSVIINSQVSSINITNYPRKYLFRPEIIELVLSENSHEQLKQERELLNCINWQYVVSKTDFVTVMFLLSTTCLAPLANSTHSFSWERSMLNDFTSYYDRLKGFNYLCLYRKEWVVRDRSISSNYILNFVFWWGSDVHLGCSYYTLVSCISRYLWRQGT